MKKGEKESNEAYIKRRTEELIIKMLDEKFETADKDTFDMKLQATRTAMVHLRDREMMKRIQQAQHLRVCTIVYDKDNVEARKDYIETAMPQITLNKDKD